MNCDNLFFLKSLENNIRIPGSVDNCLGGYKSIKYLLDGTFLNDIITENVEEEPNNFFMRGSHLAIQHNNFKELKYKIELRHRLLNLFQHIYNSQFDDSLWFVISIGAFENNIDCIYNSIDQLPNYVKSKLILTQGCPCRIGLLNNIYEYPIFNLYELFDKSEYKNEIEEWQQLSSDILINWFEKFLNKHLLFYNKLNNTNWESLKINKITNN